MTQPQAYIVAARRTAGGRRNGRLANWHPADLAGAVLDAVVADTGIDPGAIDDVILGCVGQAGEQTANIARSAVLASGLPESVPAVTVDRQCGSSQQAIQFAAQAVMSRTQDIVIAAGVESMSRIPMGFSLVPGSGLSPWSSRILERFRVQEFSQFKGAEMIARKYGFDRQMLDAFALESHRRAAAATLAGTFDKEIVPLVITTKEGTTDQHMQDEGIRYDASMEGMAGVKLIAEDGMITAATSSQICDGAAAVMIVSEEALKQHALTPLARIHNLTVVAGDPVTMLEEPIPGTQKALAKAGLRIGQIDLYEVNEAFAPIPMAWVHAIKADPEKLNVNGGAIALGHPLGASGAKLMATLIHGLQARGGRYGLQTMCEGGGIANVTIVEAL